MIESMTPEKAMELGGGGLDCSQVVFAHGAKLLGLMDEEDAYKIAACFGGGMMNGETCGCVTGALMAIGLKQGHCRFGDTQTKEAVMEVKRAYEEEFKARHGSLICRDLIGYDFGKPEDVETILTSGVLAEVCPKLIASACDILEEML